MPAKKSNSNNKKAAPKKKVVNKTVKKTVVKKVAPKKVAKTAKAVVKKTSSKKVAVAKTTVKKATPKTVGKVMPVVKTPAIKTSSFISKIETKKLVWPLVALLVIAFAYMIKDEVIVARVNGKAVSRVALIKNLEKQGASQVLEDMVLKILIEQKIKEAGVEVDQAEIDAEIQEVADMLEAQGQSLDDLLEAQNLTLKEVEDQLRLSKGMESVLANRIEVTDEEVAAYFEDNQDLLGEGADFEGMKDQIREQIRQSKLANEQQIWLEEIKSESNIKYFKFAPQTELAF